MSLEKKVSIGMFAALAGTACTEDTRTLGGVTITEAVTDSEGKAYFTETESGEEVEVRLVIKDTDFPVSDAAVLYFDNADFKAFLLNHDAFSPQLQIAEHNSGHVYSLTPAVVPTPHNSHQKENSKSGAEKYLSWAEANWEHTGCLNQENMLTLMKPGAFLMKKLNLVETLGFSEDKFDEGVQYIEDNLPESAVADVYVFIPYQHGFSASTTTITALDIKLSGGCSYGNPSAPPGNDYGSGSTGSGGNNNNDDDCSGMLFCDEFTGTSLNTSKWNIVNDSGIDVSGGWLSLPNASSIAAQNQFDSSCKDKQVDLRSASYVGSVFLGKMGLSANKDTGILACGGEDAIVNIAGAENGLSLYKSGGLLSLLVSGEVTSVPCLEDISYVQLTAGLNDKVEIDYVKVKCR
ncbi:MAG: hypothetical protein Q7S55_02845 [Nanoarchaeota archaeon]|nr:hypothetical protein [Nanoarchaeota archaeon]